MFLRTFWALKPVTTTSHHPRTSDMVEHRDGLATHTQPPTSNGERNRLPKRKAENRQNFRPIRPSNAPTTGKFRLPITSGKVLRVSVSESQPAREGQFGHLKDQYGRPARWYDRMLHRESNCPLAKDNAAVSSFVSGVFRNLKGVPGGTLQV